MDKCWCCGKDSKKISKNNRCEKCEKKAKVLIKKIKKFEFWKWAVNNTELERHSINGLKDDWAACDFYSKNPWAKSELKNKSGLS